MDMTEFRAEEVPGSQDSSKGGAVETGCSGLHDSICFVCYILLPPSTAPPSDCTPPPTAPPL